MASRQDGPFFNLKAVVQQTGLKPDTLRAWERRYGIPAPQRSSGGHRLYSRRDIETIKWLVLRQQEGLSIKRAVELWRQVEDEGRDPLDAPGPMTLPRAPVSQTWVKAENLAQLRERWISFCLSFDEQQAEQTLAEAFAFYPPEIVCLELIQEAVKQIGDGWYQGNVTVQQEHFCSALAMRRLESLLMAAPPPTRPGKILSLCPPQEEHVFGLLLLTYLLRRRGWAVVYLGPNVPVERLESTLAATRPQLVVLAAHQLHSAASLLQMAQVLQKEKVPMAYGGLVFNLIPDLRSRIPGHFLGERIDLSTKTAEDLIAAPRPLPTTEAVSEACLQAKTQFEERQGIIEAELGHVLSGSGIPVSHLSVANRALALDIRAALALGDMELMGTDIEWIRGLLSHQGVPPAVLPAYLKAYSQAIQTQMDGSGQPIADWLARVTGTSSEQTEEI